MLECKRTSTKICLENYTKRCLANLDKKHILQQYIYSSKTSSNWAQLPRHRSYSRFQHGLAINQNREEGGNRKKDNRNRGSLDSEFSSPTNWRIEFCWCLALIFFLVHPSNLASTWWSIPTVHVSRRVRVEEVEPRSPMRKPRGDGSRSPAREEGSHAWGRSMAVWRLQLQSWSNTTVTLTKPPRKKHSHKKWSIRKKCKANFGKPKTNFGLSFWYSF